MARILSSTVKLRLPEGPGPHSVAVLLHGGLWQAGFVAFATRKGDEARLVPLRGAGHFEPIDPAAPELVDVSEAVRRLVYQPSRRGASGA